MRLTSPAFEHGGPIPRRHAHDGADHSPPLAWTGVPARARSLALLCEDDPDAPLGNWVHWVLFDLPARCRGLAEGLPRRGRLADGSRQGANDFLRVGYSGPVAGDGEHGYHFRLYALDRRLALAPGARKADLTRAMQGHLLAEATLTGRYGGRPR